MLTRNHNAHEQRDFPPGTHLVSPRPLYTHHGIYAGDGRVIHYAGLAYGWRRGAVEEVSLERFAHGHELGVLGDARRFDGGEVVARARSRMGERRYRILTNNCEHFCAWAMRDELRSSQVDRMLALPRKLLRQLTPSNNRSGAPLVMG